MATAVSTALGGGSDEMLAGAPGAGPVAAFADLGSGGGVPAFVLLSLWIGTTAALIETGRRRAEFLTGALKILSWTERARVVDTRAEAAGRDPVLRGSFPLVTARSFGPPAVAAECAAPLLAVGGLLVVSEPPSAPERWPVEALDQLGLNAGRTVVAGGYHFRVLRQVAPCPERFPRRTGVPERRPLF